MAEQLTDEQYMQFLMGDDKLLNTDTREAETEYVQAYKEAETDGFYKDLQASTPPPGPRDVPDGVTQGVTGVPMNRTREERIRDKPLLSNIIDAGVSVAKGAGEMAVQAAAGVDDAVRNTLNAVPLVEEFTGWLDELAGIDTSKGIAQPKTMAGTLSREVTKFLTGYLPLARGIKAVSGVSKLGKGTQAALGAVTEFFVRAPDEQRFSDFLLKMGVPDNIVTDWLKQEGSDDGEVMSRLKNAMDGMIAPTLVEGMVRAARATKAGANFLTDKFGKPEIATKTLEYQTKKGEAITSRVQTYMTADGSMAQYVAAEEVKRAQTVAKKIGAGEKSVKDVNAEMVLSENYPVIASGGDRIYVNYGAMETPEQIRAAVRTITEHGHKHVTKAQKSMSHAEQKAFAEQMLMTTDELLNRADGTVWSASEVIAAKTLWDNAGENLVRLARKAMEPDATDYDLFMFQQFKGKYAAINAEIRGASAEASRALRAWGLNAPSLAHKARMVDDLMSEHGGLEYARELAARVVVLADNGTLKTSAGTRMLRQSVASRAVDAFREAWVAGLLWLPSTHLVNSLSAVMVLGHQLANRKVASLMSDGVHANEAAIGLNAMMASMKDAWRYAGAAFKTGDAGYWANKAETKRVSAWSAENFGLKDDSTLGKSVQMIGSGLTGSLRMLGAEDEFFKTIAYRAELHMRAYREAAAKGLKGAELDEAYRKLVNDPPEHLTVAAADFATMATFQDKGGQITNFLGKIRNDPNTNVFGRFALTMVFPFVKTPLRILNYTMEHSPFAVLNSSFRQAVTGTDKAARSLALAKVATGTTAMAIAFDLADSGVVTGAGPKDKAARALWLETHQPYSIKIGGKWHSYNRMDPLGMLFGFAGDVGDIAHRYELGSTDMDELSELSAGVALTLANVLINKNYMQGFARTLQAITDPERYGKTWLGSNIATFIPLTTLTGGVARTMDDGKLRQMNTVSDYIDSRLAWKRDRLTPVRDLYGREVHARSGYGKIYDFLTPVAGKPVAESAIADELMALAHDPLRADATVPSPIRKNTSFMGVALDFSQWPEQYDQYARLAGELEVPGTGLPLFEALDEMVKGEGIYGATYELLPSAYQKLTFIDAIIEGQRMAAQNEVAMDPRNEAFMQWLDNMRGTRADQIMGAEGAAERVELPSPEEQAGLVPIGQ